MQEAPDRSSRGVWAPFLGGVLVGCAGLVLLRSLTPRPSLDPRLLRRRGDLPLPPDTTVVVPGVLGSELLAPDGRQVWLNAGNAFGHHDLALPLALPFAEHGDGLVPGGLLGADAVLPRLFGFTEYADLVDLLRDAAVPFRLFTYDWRRDLVESARRLGETLDELAAASGDPEARFNVVGHSMGGLVARYYLRYGGAEPSSATPVSWAGARRIRHLVLVATPNGGSVPALDAILNGNRVGPSSTTLAASVIATMPAIYELLPPVSAESLLDHKGATLDLDLHDAATWERRGWGPFAPAPRSRIRRPAAPSGPSLARRRAFLEAALARARSVSDALARRPDSPCPCRVSVVGGDCLPTLARAVVPEGRHSLPRFEPWSKKEADLMLEAGDGRVTRASVLASHLPAAETSDLGCGLAEVEGAFFGSADHHGIYGEPTFQSVLLRILLKPARPRALGCADGRDAGAAAG